MIEYLLTPREAKVLSTIRNGKEVALPQLAVVARLVPSELDEVVARLEKKDLARLTEDRQFVSLTEAGCQVRSYLESEAEEIPGLPPWAGSALHKRAALWAAVGLVIGAALGGTLGGLFWGFFGGILGSAAGSAGGTLLGRSSEEVDVVILSDDDPFDDDPEDLNSESGPVDAGGSSRFGLSPPGPRQVDNPQG